MIGRGGAGDRRSQQRCHDRPDNAENNQHHSHVGYGIALLARQRSEPVPQPVFEGCGCIHDRGSNFSCFIDRTLSDYHISLSYLHNRSI